MAEEQDPTVLSARVPMNGQPVRVEWMDGRSHTKRVVHTSLDEFARMLQRTPRTEGDAGRVEEWLDLLGTRAGIAVRSQGTERMTYALALPAREQTILSKRMSGGTRDLANFEELRVPLPPTLWVIRYVRGKMTGASLFVAPQLVTSLQATQRIVAFPWGNVNSGSGVVCWGDVSIETLGPNDPWLVDDLFFRSRLNDHLWHGSIPWASNNRHWKDWLKDHPGEPMPVTFTNGSAVWPTVQMATRR